MTNGIKLKQLIASLVIKHVVVVVILQLTRHDCVSSTEYCLLEDFSPTCPQDSVILIMSARYGRMQVGRCLSRDYHLGCFADVTIQLDHLCSGRRHCHLSIPEPHLLKLVTCPNDLVSYLDADYECIKVNTFDTQGCHVIGRDPLPVLLTSPSGFITSHYFLSSGFLPSTSGIKYPSPVLDFPIFPSSLSSLSSSSSSSSSSLSSSSSSSLPLKHEEDHVISFTSSETNNCKWIIVCLPGQRSSMTLYNLHNAREVDSRSDRELQQRKQNDFNSFPQYSFQIGGRMDHHHYHHRRRRRHQEDRLERSADAHQQLRQQQQQQKQQQQQHQLNSTTDNQIVTCNGFYAVITEHDITQERFVDMITWINNNINNNNNNNNINNNNNNNNNNISAEDNQEVVTREFFLSGKRKIVCLRETRIALLHATEGKSVSLVIHLRDFHARPQKPTNNNNNNILTYNDIDFTAHNNNNNIMYLLKYSVHGCAKVVTPNEAEVTRYVDGFDVTCNVTSRSVTWSFKCSRNFWLEKDGTVLDILHPPWNRCTYHSGKAKEIPFGSQQSVYLNRVFGYLRGHETTAWLALFIGVVVGIAFGLGLLVFVSLLKKRLKGKRSSSRCLGDNMVIQQEITCLQDDVIFRRSSSNFSFWHDVSDCTEERQPRSSRHETLNAANMASIFASNPVASKPNTNKSAPVTFALVEQNYSPMICDEMRVKLNQVSLDVLTGTSQTHVFT